LLTEVRNPTTGRGKAIAVTLAVLFFSLLTVGVVSGFFLARALNPGLQGGETTDPTRLLGNAQTLEFTTPNGKLHSGWFFPGLRGAPVIVICHGYKSSREEILTLGTSLQQHRYNVFAFNFAGHGESPDPYTTLGYKESEELQAAVDMLSQRADIDAQRIGLWGYSMGGYAAVQVATRTPAVKAVAVDSVYPHPTALLQIELRGLPFLSTVAAVEFRVLSLFVGGFGGDLTSDINALAGTPKLFIVADDAPELANTTRQLYGTAPGPKDLITLPRTNMSALLAEERRGYENVVVSFFLDNLPLVAPRS
jgi:pimeloyl-ACP methyl ester carboxylesterase